jgi:NADPH:quinone reductase-like Zn-dependent oxidoreductase
LQGQNEKMKVYQIQAASGVDGLQPVDCPEPTPGLGQVLVRVRAVSLNYRDTLVVNGQYPGLTLPLIPLSDGAGEVVAIGEGVTRVKVGDRIAAIFFQDWIAGRLTRQKIKSALGGAIDGMLAEYVVLNQAGVVLLPEHLSYEEGATLPCAAVTAWQALVTRGGLTAGETVLLLGTGGVSTFALQFAQILGARIIMTSSSDEKLAHAKAMGAHETINYKTYPNWHEQVWQLTHGEGVDQVIEVGGAGTLERSLRSTRVGGRVSLIGVLSGAGEFNHTYILRNSIDVQGIFVGSREMFEGMNAAIALHQIKPVIDRVFPFSEAPAAYRYLQSGSHLGKVVIQI